MSDRENVTLYQGDGTPKDIRLYALPVAAVASTVIFLSALAASPTDIILRNTTVAPGGGSFPTQYPGLRFWDGAAVVSLCLVAEADAPAGNVPKVRKGATTYAVYLVDTTDPDASPVRLRTGAGTKSIRLLT